MCIQSMSAIGSMNYLIVTLLFYYHTASTPLWVHRHESLTMYVVQNIVQNIFHTLLNKRKHIQIILILQKRYLMEDFCLFLGKKKLCNCKTLNIVLGGTWR